MGVRPLIRPDSYDPAALHAWLIGVRRNSRVPECVFDGNPIPKPCRRRQVGAQLMGFRRRHAGAPRAHPGNPGTRGTPGHARWSHPRERGHAGSTWAHPGNPGRPEARATYPLPCAVHPFSMLYMRSGDERHSKARIRHAAIARFGRDGFDVGLRAIAADAEVSPALIVHHFGSKAGLRQACDDHVLAVIADAKLDTVGAAGPSAMLAQLAGLDEYAPYAAYAVASLAAGGDLARELVDRMAAMTEDFLADGVTEGTIKPSRDPRGRARYLTYTGLGMLLLAYRMRADSTEPPDLEGRSEERRVGKEGR